MICSMCGLVVGDRVIDVGSEWRTFSNDKGILSYSTIAGPKEGLKIRVGGASSNVVGGIHLPPIEIGGHSTTT